MTKDAKKRSKDGKKRSKDAEHRPKEDEHRSNDCEHRSNDCEQLSKDGEQPSKHVEQRSENDEQRSTDSEQKPKAPNRTSKVAEEHCTEQPTDVGEESTTQDSSESVVIEMPTCEVCCETEPELVQISKECGHETCKRCAAELVKYKLSDGTAVIPCPFHPCDQAMRPELVQELATDGLDQLYMTNSIRHAILNGNTDEIKWCPKCEKPAVGPNFEECPKITCAYCSEHFCYFCSDPWHPQRSCQDDDSKKAKNMRRCPRCAAMIYKTGGCNSMACTSCLGHFCWVCGKEIAGPLHFSGRTGCPYFEEALPSTTQKVLGLLAICLAGLILIAPVCVGVGLFVLCYTSISMLVRLGRAWCVENYTLNIIIRTVLFIVASPFVLVLSSLLAALAFTGTLFFLVGVFYFYLPLTIFVNLQPIDDFLTRRRIRRLANPVFSV